MEKDLSSWTNYNCVIINNPAVGPPESEDSAETQVISLQTAAEQAGLSKDRVILYQNDLYTDHPSEKLAILANKIEKMIASPM